MLIYGLFAGLVAILATVAIERFGGRLGGLLASIPTTIIPASLGIFERSHTPRDYVWAMSVVPIGMLVNAFFLWLWRWGPPRLPHTTLPKRLGMMILLGLTGWAVAAASGLSLAHWLKGLGVSPILLGTGVGLAQGLLGIWACLAPVPAPAGSRSVSWQMLISRGVLAGSCIVLAVWLSGLGLPLLSGLASVFPAIFLTTMAALWISQGEAVQSGAVGPMMLGSTSVSVYALVGAMALPALGPGWGCVVAWLASFILVSVPAHAWLRSRHS